MLMFFSHAFVRLYISHDFKVVKGLKINSFTSVEEYRNPLEAGESVSPVMKNQKYTFVFSQKEIDRNSLAEIKKYSENLTSWLNRLKKRNMFVYH